MMAFRPENFTMPTQHMGLLPQADGSAFGRFGRNITDAIRDNRDARLRQEQLGLQEQQFAEDRAQSRRRLGLEEQREERFAARDARREGREQREFDAKMQLHEDETARQKRLDREALISKYWSARQRGDQVAMEAAWQEMERAGLRVERPDFGSPAPTAEPEPGPGQDPTIGGTLQADDATSPERVDFDADAPPEPPKEDYDADAILAEQQTKEDIDADDVLAGGDGTPREYAQTVDYDADQPEAPSEGPAPFLSRYMGKLPEVPVTGGVTPEAVTLQENMPQPGAADRDWARGQVAGLGRGYRPLGDSTPPNVQSGRGLTVYDEDGNALVTDDMPHADLLKQQSFAVASTMKPLWELAKNEEEKAAAMEALQIGLGMVGSRPTKDIQETMLNHFYKQTGESNKMARARIAAEGHARSGGGSIGVGPAGLDPKLAEKMSDNVDRIIKGVNQMKGFNPGFREALSLTEQANGGISSGDPARQKDALRLLLQARSGKTVTEQEWNRYMDTTGFWPRISTLIGNYNPNSEAPVDPKLAAGIARILSEAKSAHRARLQEAATEARRRVLADPLLRHMPPEELEFQANVAASAFDGSDPGAAPVHKAKSGKGGTAAAPRSEPSAEEL